MTPAGSTETYFDHIKSILGEPADHSVYGSDKLLLTAGVAAYPDVLGTPIEIALPVNEMSDAVGDFLVSALLFSIREKLPITPGYSIAGLEQSAPALAKASGKTAIYFTQIEKVCPEIKSLELPEISSILGAFLISSAENEYFTENGADAFEAKVAESGGDITSVKRKSAI